MTTTTPQVRGSTCTNPDSLIDSSFEVGSDRWFSWLREPSVRSFHFESAAGKFTARREERATSTNEYWYAYRKVKGKLRKVYLGTMDELTADRLDFVAAEIGQDGWEYYSSRKSYTTAKQKRCVTATQEKDSDLDSQAKGYTTDLNQDWVTIDDDPNLDPDIDDPSDEETIRTQAQKIQGLIAEVRGLEREAGELRSQLAETKTLSARNEDLEGYLQKARKRIDQLEAKLVEAERETQQLPDLEAARDRFLSGLKLGKQSPGYKRTKATIDRFIAAVVRE